MKPYFTDSTGVVQVAHGDCRTIMAQLEAQSVDAIVSDPPYGLSFMGKEWDHGVPGVEFWQAALRVAKPGAHLVAFGGTRTFHRLTCAIEDAGFEVRDCLMWVYGSGFPKSLDVSKAIDKAAGAEREIVGRKSGRAATPIRDLRSNGYHGASARENVVDTSAITAPATNAAREWSGWGTALKPAWEPIILARKPLDGTVAENVQRWGTGALNIDACRVSGDEDGSRNRPPSRLGSETSYAQDEWTRSAVVARQDTTGKGRWPANLAHDGSEEVVSEFPERNGAVSNGRTGKPSVNCYGDRGAVQQQPGRADAGSAARFFYCAKANSHDRGHQDEETLPLFGETVPAWRNRHPTVKPTELMRWLVRLVAPKGSLVLDPFAGSGSTLIAARIEGVRAIGCEIDEHSCEDAARRLQQEVLPFA